jgi:hypothetical protein
MIFLWTAMALGTVLALEVGVDLVLAVLDSRPPMLDVVHSRVPHLHRIPAMFVLWCYATAATRQLWCNIQEIKSFPVVFCEPYTASERNRCFNNKKACVAFCEM